MRLNGEMMIDGTRNTSIAVAAGVIALGLLVTPAAAAEPSTAGGDTGEDFDVEGSPTGELDTSDSSAKLPAGEPDVQPESATGFAWWGAFSMNVNGQTISIPSGQLTHMIEGQGTTVESQGAHFVSAGTICNWRIDFLYYRTDDTFDGRSTGSTNHTCNNQGNRDEWYNYPTGMTVYPGYSCAVLYSNSQQVARQCHNITR